MGFLIYWQDTKSASEFRFLSALIGLLSSFWVPLSISVKILVILMAIDMITGIVLAAREGKLNSSAGFKGVTKKAAVLIIVLTAYVMQHLAEGQVGNGFAFPLQLGAAVALAYDVIEAVSIVENCHCLGAPIPNVLVNTLRKAGELVKSDDPMIRVKDDPNA